LAEAKVDVDWRLPVAGALWTQLVPIVGQNVRDGVRVVPVAPVADYTLFAGNGLLREMHRQN